MFLHLVTKLDAEILGCSNTFSMSKASPQKALSLSVTMFVKWEGSVELVIRNFTKRNGVSFQET